MEAELEVYAMGNFDPDTVDILEYNSELYENCAEAEQGHEVCILSLVVKCETTEMSDALAKALGADLGKPETWYIQKLKEDQRFALGQFAWDYKQYKKEVRKLITLATAGYEIMLHPCM